MNQKTRKQASKVAKLATFYHFAPARLAPGSTIEPGSYGGNIRRYQGWSQDGRQATFGNPWTLARELHFELIRVQHFAKRPSRLECAFCLPSLKDAEAYRVAWAHGQILHEVKLGNPDANTFTTSMHYIDFPGPDVLFMETTKKNATAYWSPVPAGDVLETLTMSALVVTANID